MTAAWGKSQGRLNLPWPQRHLQIGILRSDAGAPQLGSRRNQAMDLLLTSIDALLNWLVFTKPSRAAWLLL